MWAASCLASCCAACACNACQTVVSGISRRSARIAYCGLFALSLIVAWILREVAAPLMEKIPCKTKILSFQSFLKSKNMYIISRCNAVCVIIYLLQGLIIFTKHQIGNGLRLMLFWELVWGTFCFSQFFLF